MSAVPRACVVGWPARHSRSPLIHAYWLRQLGIAGEYGIEEVAPEDFSRFIKDLSAKGYVGCNVTVPHKEAALQLADRADDTARAVGAANTLWLGEGGALMATNTDVEGFLASLDEARPGWDRARGDVVVLGAGGAARGIVFGLVSRGAGQVRIVNRSTARAEALAAAHGGRVSAHGWSDLPDLLAAAGLLVNTTSLGMPGGPPLDIDLRPLPAAATVADIVYVPLETALLRTARTRGNPTVGGLGMLLHQAVPGFERWFGVRPEVTDELKALVAADLDGR